MQNKDVVMKGANQKINTITTKKKQEPHLLFVLIGLIVLWHLDFKYEKQANKVLQIDANPTW